jgi:hypothetical protein
MRARGRANPRGTLYHLKEVMFEASANPVTTPNATPRRDFA